MVRFIAVAPEEIPNIREGHRGRVSYPILKDFLESGLEIAQLDRAGLKQSNFALSSTLNSYIRSHDLPVKIFTRGGQLYFARTDVGGTGLAAAPGSPEEIPFEDLPMIDSGEIARRLVDAGRDATR